MVESKSANPLNDFNGHSEKSVEYSLKGINTTIQNEHGIGVCYREAHSSPTAQHHDADDCNSHSDQHHRQRPPHSSNRPVRRPVSPSALQPVLGARSASQFDGLMQGLISAARHGPARCHRGPQFH